MINSFLKKLRQYIDVHDFLLHQEDIYKYCKLAHGQQIGIESDHQFNDDLTLIPHL